LLVLLCHLAIFKFKFKFSDIVFERNKDLDSHIYFVLSFCDLLFDCSVLVAGVCELVSDTVELVLGKVFGFCGLLKFLI
jgi:hypothetical protein